MSIRPFLVFSTITFLLLFVATLSARADVSEGFVEQDQMTVKKNVPYVKDGGIRQQLDIFLPKEFKSVEKPYPVLVWIHGGGWMAGSKEGMDVAATHSIEAGYAFISINYRFAPQDRYPAQIQDCKAAIRWLRAHAKELNLDPRRLGVWGASAGGHLAALLAVTGKDKTFDVGDHLDQSSEIQAACDFFGPKDFLILADYPAYDRFGDATGMIASLLGAAPAESRDLAAQASPIRFVHKDSAPILILHGTKDILVPVEQSIEFDRAMKKVGADCELVVLAGSGHGGKEFFDEANGGKIVAFFIKHLKGETDKDR